jgi:hypothetical protein
MQTGKFELSHPRITGKLIPPVLTASGVVATPRPKNG